MHPSLRARLLASIPTTCLALAVALPAQVWRGAGDFAANANPNGAWSYGWSQSRGSGFQLMPNAIQGCANLMPGWQQNGNPTLCKNVDANTVCCSTWTCPPGRLLLHPGGSGENAVLRFTVPTAGAYAVQAEFFGLDSVGTTSDVSVLLNGLTLYSAEVVGNQCGTPCVSTVCTNGWSFGTALLLAAGETLDSCVGFGSNQNYGFDATSVDAIVRRLYVPANVVLGTGCGLQPAIPVLASTTPGLGTPFTLSIQHAPALATGTLFLSLLPPAPLPLPYGCTVYLDLSMLIPVFSPLTADAAGNWSQVVLLPVDPAFAGLTVHAQALFAPTLAPLGASLSNGLSLTFGL